jgi:hypothetical protein
VTMVTVTDRSEASDHSWDGDVRQDPLEDEDASGDDGEDEGVVADDAFAVQGQILESELLQNLPRRQKRENLEVKREKMSEKLDLHLFSSRDMWLWVVHRISMGPGEQKRVAKSVPSSGDLFIAQGLMRLTESRTMMM